MDKNFGDFLATLTEEEFIKLSQEVNEDKITIKSDPNVGITQETLQGLFRLNINLTLKLLRRYHQWLQS